MQKPELPLDEAERLAALESYAILDTGTEPEFDALTRLAASIFDTPIALVSLVDQHRQWFKSRFGLEATETPRDVAFCAHAIHGDQPLVVPNAAEDQRFHDNPLVLSGPSIRFYAGAPLVDASGRRLGTLCVIDRQPKQPSAKQLDQLELLARQVVKLMELRRVARQLAEALERVRTLARLIPICAHCRQVRNDQQYWTSVEEYIHAHTGSDFTHGICPTCYQQHYGDLPG